MLNDFPGQLVSREYRPGRPVLRLFGTPRVTVDDQRLELPDAAKRLAMFLALQSGPVNRPHVARALWPDVGTARADGNLRSALWRMSPFRDRVLTLTGNLLGLHDDVLVDARAVTHWAARVADGLGTEADLATAPAVADALDLLPGWYDEWVLAERDRVRDRLLTALERISGILATSDRCAEAVQVAMVAVTADPLRESAQRALMEAHLAEGNWVEARRSLSVYRRLLRRELGIEPDPCLVKLLRPRVAPDHHRTASAA
jgi:DNA-binding SARP family transcriptional activator